MELKLKSENKFFNGVQRVYSHYSDTCGCDMTFGLFLPNIALNKKVPLLWFLAGLTCTHENAMTKAGAQQWAAEKDIALIFPDTSPRGKDIPDDKSFDLGQGAGFYLNATKKLWKNNYNMETYIKEELSELLFKNFELDENRQGVTGHSMGGLGALNLAIKNPNQFKSVSAFSPIANPTESDWGKKQFKSYLGDDEDTWAHYDPSLLLKKLGYNSAILIDQGTSDDFIDLLKPESIGKQFKENSGLGNFRYQEGYDHSYYFVATFMKDHISHHANLLAQG